MNLRNGPSRPTPSPAYRILVAVRTEQELHTLLQTAYALARSHERGEIRVLTVTRSGNAPSWFSTPAAEISVEMVTRNHRNVGAAILAETREYDPDLLLLTTRGQRRDGRYLLGRVLDPVIQGAACDVIVQRGEIPPRIECVLIPAAGGPNAPRALTLARELAPNARIVALYIADERLGQAEVWLGESRLSMMAERLSPEDRKAVEIKVKQATTPVEGILAEARQGYDLIILGAGHEGLIDRFLFGDIPQLALDQSPIATMVVRRRLTYLSTFWRQLWGRIFGLVPPLTLQEQAEVQRGMRRGSQPSPDFFITLTLAAILAGLGLLMNNAAIIIGAMIVAPLMTAILGMGLSIVLGDLRFFWRAGATTLRGVLMAVAMGLIVGQFVPGAGPTDAIMLLSKPSILDLAVALTAGTAAAYAVSRREISAALAGIAVATSLTPPLVTIGLGLAFRDLAIASGAALIFSANLVAIVATSGFIFLWMGFRPQPGDPNRTATQRRGFSTFGILLVLISIPLTIFTQQSLRQVGLNRTVESIIRNEIGQLRDGEVVEWDYVIAQDGTLHLDLTVRVSDTVSYTSARDLQERMAQELGRPVALSLAMVPAQRLRAYVPPTETLTPTAAPTGTPTATPTPHSTATPTTPPTPTLTPTPTVSPSPTVLFTAMPTSTPWTARVTGAEEAGLPVHYAPGGLIVGRLTEGAGVVILQGPIDIGSTQWYRVSSAMTYLEGWVDGTYLDFVPGVPTP